MVVRSETFQKLENCPHENFDNTDNIERDVWIELVQFYSLHYTNHGRYLPGDETLELKHKRNMRKVYLAFYLSRFPVVPADLHSNQVLDFIALQNIDVGKEFYCDCDIPNNVSTLPIKLHCFS